jgi:hypothetical protein
MSLEWQQYERRYSERHGTYMAYVDVWRRMPEAQHTFSGWASFSQAANAEPAQVRDHPGRVRAAEHLMRSGGYEVGAPTRRGARQWVKRP